MRSLRIALSHGDDDAYGNYPAALRRVGAALGYAVEPVWLASPDAAGFDGIVFTGGADVDPARYGRDDARALCEVDAERDAFEFAILDGLDARMPTLAVCRGAQLINVHRGGTLDPHLATAHDHVRANGRDNEHAVRVSSDSMLRPFAEDEAATNSSHHQAVARLAGGFRATAHADDGTIEAYERAASGAPFFLAVQWHPERMAGRPLGDGPIGTFLKACAAGARSGGA